ncbi:MAG: chloride channel protein [Clostridia bacterium]|nr:chloride channel protein [Clostridia bacterium]
MNNRRTKQIINLVMPALVFGSFTGVFTALAVLVFKFCARHAVALSHKAYGLISGHLWLVPVALGLMAIVALGLSFVYRHVPNAMGGGIPTAIGVLRGLVVFRWFAALAGTFTASLVSFLLGVPLGTEGPSVLMGTAVGKGIMRPFGSHKAWERYSMTGGACAGFSVATGAPVSGIMFAVEEAHQRISPMIFLVSAVSVAASHFTAELLSPVFGEELRLFPRLEMVSLSFGELWLPICIGLLSGLFAVVFLKFYRTVERFISRRLNKVPHWVRIFAVFALTLCAGLCSFSFVSTGHHLMPDVMAGGVGLGLLCATLLVRSALTVLASTNSLTGGIFLPIMAIGTVFAALIAKAALGLGLGEEYYLPIVTVGIAACISGMMKMPLTAIVFSVEALSCDGNIIHVVAAVTAAYMITEIFDAKSINDTVLDRLLEKLNEGRKQTVIDTFVSVKDNSFAVGKQIRDILWPANLFVLSVQHSRTSSALVDEHGGNALRAGDRLHVRYSTFNEEQTKKELTAIVGDQSYAETEDDIV